MTLHPGLHQMVLVNPLPRIPQTASASLKSLISSASESVSGLSTVQPRFSKNLLNSLRFAMARNDPSRSMMKRLGPANDFAAWGRNRSRKNSTEYGLSHTTIETGELNQ